MKGIALGWGGCDRQHIALFGAVSRLLDATSKMQGRQQIGSLLDFLGKYVVEHFADKEKVVAWVRYPEMVGHKEEHSNFLNDFALIQEQLKVEEASTQLVLVLQRRVCDWLISHIGRTDKKFGLLLQQSEQKSQPQLRRRPSLLPVTLNWPVAYKTTGRLSVRVGFGI